MSVTQKRRRSEMVNLESERTTSQNSPPTHPSSNQLETFNTENTDLIVRNPINDSKLTQFIYETGENESPRYCLVPCPCRHTSSSFRFHISIDGNTRIICNCIVWPHMKFDRKFRNLTKEEYWKNWQRMDLKPYSLELMKNVKYHDPTLHTPLFVPQGMKSNEVEQPFYGDDSFQPCKNDHQNQPVLLLHVRGGTSIIVCQCQDHLIYKYRGRFVNDFFRIYNQTTVFKYTSPKNRGFTTVPHVGFIVL